ncbi:hypothetical protein KY332_02505 [Candidatus Woesearchaeota archaeon]|nr:hypothetical protein [Candidatus Woesearchaeota archaeon]
MKDKETEGKGILGKLGKSLEYIVSGSKYIASQIKEAWDYTSFSTKLLIATGAITIATAAAAHGQEKNDKRPSINIPTYEGLTFPKKAHDIAARFIKKAEDKGKTTDEIKKALRKVDKNNDAEITIDEFKEAWNLNGDGEIDDRELGYVIYNMEDDLFDLDITTTYEIDGKSEAFDAYLKKRLPEEHNTILEKIFNDYLEKLTEEERNKLLEKEGPHLIPLEEADAYLAKVIEEEMKKKQEKPSAKIDHRIGVEAALKCKDNRGPVYTFDYFRFVDSEKSMRFSGQILELERYLPDQDKPSKRRGNVGIFEHNLGWLNYHVGIDAFQDTLNILSKYSTMMGTLSVDERNNERFNDKSTQAWAGIDFSLGKNAFVIEYGKKDIIEKTTNNNLTITQGDIWTEISPGVWGWVHYYDDSRRTDTSEFKDIANIINLEYIRDIGNKTKLFGLGRAIKGEITFNLESILNGTPQNIPDPDSEEYMIWLLGAGGKYLSDNFAGLAFVYGLSGTNVSPEEKAGLHFAGAWRINDNNTFGGDLSYHNKNLGTRFSYIYSPKKVEMKKHSEFLKSHVYDLIPISVISSNGWYLINRRRYEDMVGEGGFAFHGGPIFETGEGGGDKDTFYILGFAYGITENMVLDYMRVQNEISHLDSLGFSFSAKTIPLSVKVKVGRSSIEHNEGTEDSMQYSAGLDFRI